MLTRAQKAADTRRRNAESAARMAAAKAATAAVVASGVCPDCGSKVKRNLSLTGWWQCEQYGAEGFRARANSPACNWQGVRMTDVRIKLSAAQLTALDTAGAFEEPLDDDEATLAAALQGCHLVTADPRKLAAIISELSNAADDRAENRNYDFNHLDAGDRRMYRTDREVFSRLARKLREISVVS